MLTLLIHNYCQNEKHVKGSVFYPHAEQVAVLLELYAKAHSENSISSCCYRFLCMIVCSFFKRARHLIQYLIACLFPNFTKHKTDV